jgi:subtilisin family serine protease
VIATFSGRGPVTVDGSGRIKPDVCAPGVNVRSAATGGGYVITSGASVAVPHVAGLVALLVTANPGLHRQVGALEELIAGTAVPRLSSQCGGTGVPNNVYGYGRIDAAAACGAATTGLAIPDAATVTLSCTPNPWNPRATFRVVVPTAGHVLLAVYDVAGREVARLMDETLAGGAHEIVWDGSAASASLPSGTYLCRLETPWGVRTTKLQLVR